MTGAEKDDVLGLEFVKDVGLGVAVEIIIVRLRYLQMGSNLAH